MFNITKMKDLVRISDASYKDANAFIRPFDDAVRKLDEHQLLIGGPVEEIGFEFFWRFRSENKDSYANSINLHIGFDLTVSEADKLVANILIKKIKYSFADHDGDLLIWNDITLEGDDNVVEVAEEIIRIAETYYLMDELLPKLRPNLRSKAIDLLPL